MHSKIKIKTTFLLLYFYTCPDKPVFTPSALVVNYGDPAFATCVACQSGCDESRANLEASGYKEKNGSTIKWKVSSLTEWKSDPICYYTDHNGTQCCSTLKVTLYQMPTNVSISVLNHSGPMLEKSRYNLVCEVRDVAPAENLVVTFYRGHTELGQEQFSRPTSRKPETGSFSLSFNITKEDDGAQFSCGAKLELGPEGPQRPLVVRSQSLTATVHCKSNGNTIQCKQTMLNWGRVLTNKTMPWTVFPFKY
uniref:Ig-like domain-containing protein n=1 Tax=Oryzias latipes TaxID=8090 RepID=A0A3P9KL54_ORYLA